MKQRFSEKLIKLKIPVPNLQEFPLNWHQKSNNIKEKKTVYNKFYKNLL